MGVLEWLARSVGRDLDRRVHGPAGRATVRYPELRDDARVMVRATLGPGLRGDITLETRREGEVTRRERVEGALTHDLGPGELHRGTALVLAADATGGPPGSLAVLTAEIWQPDPERAEAPPLSRQTYSVEARVGEGPTRLAIEVEIGASR